jgi:UDP-glucose 4-epimerase
MHIVVTGGAGFIGSHLVDLLLQGRDDTVLVVDNMRRGRLSNLAHHDRDRRFRLLVGDIRDEAFVHSALRGADLVYHLAAQSNVMGALSNPRYSFETNVAGTFNVLDAALQQGVRRVIFASSREAYGETTRLPVDEDQPLVAKNLYGASKAAAEAYCRTFTNSLGLPTVILRFANVYGPRDFDRVIPIWVGRALAGEPLDMFGGRQLIDFVPVQVAAEALLCAAAADVVGTPVNVASGVGTPIQELAARILAVTRSTSSIRVQPSRDAEVVRFVADTTRMETLLDVRPPRDPLERLHELVATLAEKRG